MRANIFNNELINKIKEYITKENKAGKNFARLHSSDYKPINFSRDNFHEIKEIKDNLKNKIAFVDGGSCVILNSVDFALSLIRICCVIFSENKLLSIKRNDFFLIVNAMDKDEIFYTAEIFPLNYSLFSKNTFEFSSLEKSLMTGNHRANISKITDVVRRLAELMMSKESLNILDNNDILVIDGLLECDLAEEQEIMQWLKDTAQKKNIFVSALSKTNTIFCNNGEVFSSFLNRNSPFEMWYYHPVAENTAESKSHHEIIFVKLHRNSKHVFRFELFKQHNFKKINPELFCILANNSKDPVFLGYPYGLIEADRLARISNTEAGILRNSIIARLRSDKFQLSPHEILDRMGF